IISSLISAKVANYEQTEEEKQELIAKNIELKEKLGLKDIAPVFIGNDKVIRGILQTVEIIADTDATVLITGTTGTGKEVLAKKIHYSSKRMNQPFISVNCAAIPGNLIE